MPVLVFSSIIYVIAGTCFVISAFVLKEWITLAYAAISYSTALFFYLGRRSEKADEKRMEQEKKELEAIIKKEQEKQEWEKKPAHEKGGIGITTITKKD
jgi:hypothetical protein